MAKYNFPVDPECPWVVAYYKALANDPMTAYSGCMDEIWEAFKNKHRVSCKRCQEHGAANVEVV